MTILTNKYITTHLELQSRAFAGLRADVKGRVITPEDADYDAIRVRLNLEVIRRPAVIVRAANADDVSRVIAFAHETGLELAIRGGGHSLAGFSTSEGGIVLDMLNMKGLEIDLDARTVWAESGLTAGEVTQAVGNHGLVIGFGDTPSVGIAGLTTGGGIGYLVRKYGLTIDNLLAVRIVTADGVQRYADAETEPDLFWAIRGGSGNFGVVTHFKYRLHSVEQILGGVLVLPARPDVIAAFARAAAAAPDELSSIVSIMPAPPAPFIPQQYHGEVVMWATMVYTGDLEEGQRVLAPFRQIAEPIADLLSPMTYPEIYQFAESPDFTSVFAVRSKFIDTIDEATAQILLDRVHAGHGGMPIAEFRVLGGAMARVPAEATAFAHRSARVMMSFILVYQNREDEHMQTAWAQGGIDALTQSAGVYVNFVGDEGKARLRDAYPAATMERLAAIKAQYDPTNFFRRNHNIAPKAK